MKSGPVVAQQRENNCASQIGELLVDYLVPINICITGQQAASTTAASQLAPQQPSIHEQPLIDCVAWALVSRTSGLVEWRRSARCCATATATGRTSSESLEEVLKEIDSSLEGKSCLLVTCGPINLRQYLHPIAKRLKVELSETFCQYADLLKEFDRCSFAGIPGRQVVARQWQQHGGLRNNTCDSSSSCCHEVVVVENFYSPKSMNAMTQQQQQQQTAPSGRESTSTPAGQQISTGARKRFEEILKFLNIKSPDVTQCEEPLTSSTGSSSSSKRPGNSTAVINPSESTNGQLNSMCSIVARLLAEGHQFNRFERIKRRVEVGLCDSSASEAEQRVVRARGLPWQASEQDIADFFAGLHIIKGGVSLCLSRQGRRNGEALVQFESREHRNLALSRHKHFMGQRYIEVYRASGEDFQSVAAGYNNKAEAFLSRGAQAIVRMRGLPFTCTARQVVEFFASEAPVLAGDEGVLFVKNQDEKPSGDAFVLFAHEQHAKRALAKHHQNIGSRYVELFRSTVSEVQQVLSIQSQQQDTPLQANSSKVVAATPTPTPPTTKESSSAFPALSERPIVWQRPEAATYAQVAHARACRQVEEGAKIESERRPEVEGDEPTSEEEEKVAADDDDADDTTSEREETKEPEVEPQEEVEAAAAAAPAEPPMQQETQQQQQQQQPNNYQPQFQQRARHYYPMTRAPYATHHHHHHHHHRQHYTPQAAHHLSTYSAPPAYAPLIYTAPAEQSLSSSSTTAPPKNTIAQQQQQHHYSAHYYQHAHPFGNYATAAAAIDPNLTSRRDCIRLRGLPFEAQIEHVLAFLGSKHSEHILYQGVHMVYSAQGQPTGEAIIQMDSCQAAMAAAQQAHRRVMSVGKKQRYIEVIPSSIDDMKPTLGYGLAAFAASRATAAAYQQQCQTGSGTLTSGAYHQHYYEQATNGCSYAPAVEYPPATPTSEEPLTACATPTKQQNSDTSSIDSGLSGAEELHVKEADLVSGGSGGGGGEQSSVIQQAPPLDQQQQQQALVAAHAAAYYPILYYYPPPPPPPHMLGH